MADDLINATECQEIVKNSFVGTTNATPSFKVLSYEIRRLGDDVLGFLGEYYRLIVQIEQNAKVEEKSFFVKSMIQAGETRKRMEDMFRKEVQIYGELFSKWSQSGDTFDELFKWRPECYFTRSNLIVLEELNADYQHIPYRGVFDRQHCEEMLKAMAKMHASSINFERNSLNGEKLDKNYGHLVFECPLQKGNQWFNVGLELIYFVAQNYSDHFKDVKIPDRDEFMSQLYTVFKYRDEVNDFEKVLCHRDLWQSNMFFKYSKDLQPEHCVIIDFQFCHYQSPILDLLIAMFVNTRKEFRARELHNCFKFYLDYLKETLMETFKFTSEDVERLRFMKETEFEMLRKHYQLYALITNCMFAPVNQLKPGTINRIEREDPEKYFNICKVSRNEFTREFMESDPYYKEYVLEAVEELVEYLFKDK